MSDHGIPRTKLIYPVLIVGSMLTNDEDDEQNTVVAVKVPKLKSFTPGNDFLEAFCNEIKTTLSFNHEHVVRCLGFYLNAGHSYPHLVMEFMDHGSLENLLDKSSDSLSLVSTGIPQFLRF